MASAGMAKYHEYLRKWMKKYALFGLPHPVKSIRGSSKGGTLRLALRRFLTVLFIFVICPALLSCSPSCRSDAESDDTLLEGSPIDEGDTDTGDGGTGSGGEEESGEGGETEPAGVFPDDLIRIAVFGVTEECVDKMYAVHYDDNFETADARVDEPEATPLDNCIGTSTFSCTGDLPVEPGEDPLIIYVFCDLSQGDEAYDDGTEEADIDMPFEYTNTGVFNACSRAMTVPPNAQGTTPTYFSSFTSNAQNKLSVPAVMSQNNENAAAGDAFTVFMSTPGSQEVIPFADNIAQLSDDPHPANGQTLQKWCNCILGEFMVADNPTTPNKMTFFNLMNPATATYPGPYYIGYFTDTNQDQDSEGADCILP